ncbi:hypothetical protein ACINK0_00965 [Deinococcus sp. VB343]|uniref:hypothetical protein n=1 Tax=Deinococcus sp. VB343 TaxID=3385567 RepID=UPI0039C9F958
MDISDLISVLERQADLLEEIRDALKSIETDISTIDSQTFDMKWDISSIKDYTDRIDDNVSAIKIHLDFSE